MDKIENVTVIKKANVYFDGKVTSRTVLFEDGSKKSLGLFVQGNTYRKLYKPISFINFTINFKGNSKNE